MRKLERTVEEDIPKKVNDYLEDKKKINETKTDIHFTPVRKESSSSYLPFNTPFNLHKSMSDELEECSLNESFFQPSGRNSFTPSDEPENSEHLQRSRSTSSQIEESDKASEHIQPTKSSAQTEEFIKVSQSSQQALHTDSSVPPPGYTHSHAGEFLSYETPNHIEEQSFLARGSLNLSNS